MATIVTRAGKGSPLTSSELDQNQINLNTDKAELSGATFTGEIVAPSLDISGNIDVDGVTNLDVVDIDGAVDMASTLAVGGEVTIASNIVHAGDTNTFFGFHSSDLFRVTTGGVGRFEVSDSAVIINDSSQDMDFRVESNGNANMLFVDGGNDQVFIGATSASALNTFGDDLVVVNTTAGTGAGISIIANATNGYSNVYFGDTADGDIGRVQYNHGDNSMTFRTNAADALVIASSGSATFSSTVTSTGLTSTGGGSISGNLLVGASSAAGKLTVGTFGDTARAAQFHGGSILVDGGAASEIIIGDGNVAYMSIQTTDDATAMKIRNYSGNADLVTIERASGNVGIGTSSPVRPLSVKGSQEQLTLSEGDARGATFDYRSSTGNLNIATNGINARTSPQFTLDLNGNVGIGCTPSAKLHIKGGSDMGIRIESDNDGYANLQFGDADDVVRGSISYNNADDSLQLRGYNNTERMRIDSSGSVNISGSASGAEQFRVGNSTGGTDFGITVTENSGVILNSAEGSTARSMTFSSGGSPKMTIDSSGNVLVGQTSNSETGSGIGLVPDGTSHMYSGSTDALMLGRGGSDGEILSFNKSGTTVGSIGTYTGYTRIGGNTNSGFIFRSNQILPWNNSTSDYADGTQDLGTGSGARFKDLYLSGGVYLGGTGAANKLSDVEAGTWTPAIVAYAGTNPSVSGTSSGFYTKIGQLVTVSFSFDSISVSGTTGGIMKISGLPFAFNGDSGGAYTGNQITLQRPDTSSVLSLADGFGILSQNNGGSWAWELVSIFDGSSALRATVSYRTNS